VRVNHDRSRFQPASTSLCVTIDRMPETRAPGEQFQATAFGEDWRSTERVTVMHDEASARIVLSRRRLTGRCSRRAAPMLCQHSTRSDPGPGRVGESPLAAERHDVMRIRIANDVSNSRGDG